MDKTEHVNNPDEILNLIDVSTGYGNRQILSHINLSLKKGEVVGLIGGSGSGKTTLLRTITGQIPPLAGEVWVAEQRLDGASRKELSQLRQHMGVLFQQGALFTDLDVFENVAFPLRELTKDTEAEITDKVLSRLDAVGLRATAHLRVSQISGGMARRVALARTIVMEPELLLYDEPFAGLDPISMRRTAALIRQLANDLGCGSLLITHDIEESFEIVDQVYMIGHGGLIAHGTPQELRASSNERVQRFLVGASADERSEGYPETPEFQEWLAKKQKQVKA